MPNLNNNNILQNTRNCELSVSENLSIATLVSKFKTKQRGYRTLGTDSNSGSHFEIKKTLKAIISRKDRCSKQKFSRMRLFKTFVQTSGILRKS